MQIATGIILVLIVTISMFNTSLKIMERNRAEREKASKG